MLRRGLLPLFLLLSAAPAVAQSTTDALHYRLEIEPLFASRSIQATNVATFRSLVDNLTTIDLDLHSAHVVSTVRMGAKDVTFSRPTNVVRVTLDRAYAKDETFSVEIAYAGTPPSGSMGGGFVFTTHNSQPMAWTLSEPWDAKLWWPGKDVLMDKSTFEMWIIHPDTMTAASNGVLQGTDTLPGNRLRTRWKESYPIVPYLVSLAVTNYQKRVDSYQHLNDTMPVEFYVFPESWASWQPGLDLIVPMLKTFADVYGQYPFVKEKYGIAQFTWGGGMEHQTITSQSGVNDWLSAHEMAHSWWGDMITCATWHDIWLNEGFATFSEAVYFERRPGGNIAAYHNWIRQRRPSNVNGVVYVTNITNVNGIFSSNNVYNKGGWVLHQLRHVLGDQVFFQCLADYRKAFEGSSATTEDFRKVCEKTAGRDLTWFFDQWVMKGGAPTYSQGWVVRRVNGVDYLCLQLDQVQASPPLFLMPVDVRVQTASGAQTYVIWNDERQDQLALRLTGPATSVTIDPDQWILRASTVGTRAFTQPFYAAAPESIDTVQGGSAELIADQGSAAADRIYLTLIGASGSVPGIKVGTLQIPLNLDVLTDIGLAALNSPVFANFLGKLDANGLGLATLALPPGLGTVLKGKTLTACYVLVDRLDFASRAARIELR